MSDSESWARGPSARTVAASGAEPGILVGRDELVAEVAAAVAVDAPVRLWGTPGVGRHRVALAACARLSDEPPLVIGADDRRLTEMPARSALRAGPAGAAIVDLHGAEPGADLDEWACRAGVALIFVATGPSARVPSIHVPPLGRTDSAALVLATAPTLGEPVAATIAHLGSGLPATLIAVARATAAAAGQVTIPPVVAEPVLARLSEVGEAARDIATWVALGGLPADPREVAALVGGSPDEIARTIDELFVARLMDEPARPQERKSLRLRDPVAARLLVDALGPNERASRQRRALEVGRDAGWPSVDLMPLAQALGDRPLAVALAVEAADEVRLHGRLEDSAELARFAIEQWTPGMEPTLRATAHSILAGHYFDLFLDSLAAKHHRAALVRVGPGRDPETFDAAAADWMSGDKTDAPRRLTRSASAASPREMFTAAYAAADAGHFREALGVTRAIRREDAAEIVMARTWQVIAISRSALAGRCLSTYLDYGKRRARLAGSTRSAAALSVAESHLLQISGEPRRARDIAVRALEALGSDVSPDAAVILHGNVAEGSIALGELARGRTELDMAEALAAAIGGGADFVTTPARWLPFAEGDLLATLARCGEVDPPTAYRSARALDLVGLAVPHVLATIQLGELDIARALATSLVERWRAGEDALQAGQVLATALAARPEDDRAVRDLAAAARSDLALARECLVLGQAHVLRRSEPARAARAYRAAAEAFGAREMAWYAAWARLQAGSVEPDRDRSAKDLFEARRRFAAMGAGGWVAIVDAALRDIGRRPPPDGDAEVATISDLTPRETEILRYLMLNLSNREVGERLVISERTVARHVAQVLAKLGVNNRRAAARLGREGGLSPAEETHTP